MLLINYVHFVRGGAMIVVFSQYSQERFGDGDRRGRDIELRRKLSCLYTNIHYSIYKATKVIAEIFAVTMATQLLYYHWKCKMPPC